MSDIDAVGEGRVGARLRTAREAMGLTIDEVSQRTRVRPSNLQAIEDGRYEGLPAATYSAGFVRAYARTVGLDPEPLSRAFRAELGRTAPAAPETPRYEPVDPARVPSRLLAWTAALIFLLLAVGYGVWRSGVLSGDGAEDAARLAAGTDVTSAPPPVSDAPPRPLAGPAPVVGGAVTLLAVQPVWMRIVERGGATLFIGELAAGERFAIPATARDPLLRTGRPEALAIDVGGRRAAPVGAPATTVDDVSLKPEALLARPMPADPSPASPAAQAPQPLVPPGGIGETPPR